MGSRGSQGQTFLSNPSNGDVVVVVGAHSGARLDSRKIRGLAVEVLLAELTVRYEYLGKVGTQRAGSIAFGFK